MAIKTCRCGGKLEASSKVYFDIELSEAGEITSLAYSSQNDLYRGHPVAITMGEMTVSCEDCGRDHEGWDTGDLEVWSSPQEIAHAGDDLGRGGAPGMVSIESVREALRDAYVEDSAASAVEYVSDLVGWSAEDDPEMRNRTREN